MCAGLSEESIAYILLVSVGMHCPTPCARRPILLAEKVIHLLPLLPESRVPILYNWSVAGLMVTPAYTYSSVAADCALRIVLVVKPYCAI